MRVETITRRLPYLSGAIAATFGALALLAFVAYRNERAMRLRIMQAYIDRLNIAARGGRHG